jgi:hypothetical protein
MRSQAATYHMTSGVTAYTPARNLTRVSLSHEAYRQ